MLKATEPRMNKDTRKTIVCFLTGLLLAGSLTLTSCLQEEEKEDVFSTPQCALLSFSINDIKTKKTTTLSNGTDTTYTVNTPGSLFPFTIDQERNLVYNKDSVTYGVQTERISVKCSADGAASIYYQKDGERVSFTSGDTLDLTHPVTFTIVSSDEMYSRDYLVTLNVHQANPDATSWHKVNRPVDFEQWKPNVSDVVADFLGAHQADHVMGVRYPLLTNGNIERKLVVCYDDAATDTLAHVWVRLSSEDRWTEMVPSADNVYGCPLLDNLCVVRYGGCLYAFGGKSRGGRVVPIEAFERTFVSVDNGITWRTFSDKLSLPKELRGYEGKFDVAVDADNYMWIVLEDDTAWKGKLNGL